METHLALVVFKDVLEPVRPGGQLWLTNAGRAVVVWVVE